jgi:Spy/CpxP family protein refolding chaperone
MKKTIIVILVTVMISSLMAQPGAHQKPRMPHKSFGAIGMAHGGPQGFGQPSERMEMMMTWKLTEELELTPEQADKFFPRMKVHRENMEKIDVDIRNVVKDLREKVKDEKDISDSEFSTTIQKVSTLEKQKIDEKNRFFTEMKGILENSQRAKLAMFKDRFAKDMQEQIRAKRKTMAK